MNSVANILKVCQPKVPEIISLGSFENKEL